MLSSSDEKKVSEIIKEEMDSMFNKLLGVLDAKFEFINVKFEAIDRRFEAIDRRFEAIDRRFEATDQKFVTIDQKFKEVAAAFIIVNQHIDKQGEDINETFQTSFQGMIDDLRTEMKVEFKKVSEKLDEFREFKDSTSYRLQHIEMSIFSGITDRPICAEKTYVPKYNLKEECDKLKKRLKQKP